MDCGTPNKRLRRKQLVKVATRVLGSAEAADRWLNTPQPTFGNAVPLFMTDTLDGFQRVLEELEAMTAPSPP